MRFEPWSHVHIEEQWKPQLKTSKTSFHVSPEQKVKLEFTIAHSDLDRFKFKNKITHCYFDEGWP